jgi:hypothetical protein
MDESPSWEVNSHSVKKFPAFYGPRRFSAVFTEARRWFLSWSWWIRSTTSHHVPVRSILVLVPSTPRSSDWSLPFRSSDQNFVFISHLSYAYYMPHPSNSAGIDHPNNIWWSLQVTKPLSMRSSPAYRHLLPLRSKYSPQHPVLIHSQF